MMRKTRENETPRLGGRTRRLDQPGGIGPWALLAAAVLASVGAVLLTLPEARPAQAAQAQETLEIWLVRHAEKADDSRDPALSADGRARARLLASLLEGEGIGRIHSTDYRRTRSTAQPLAEALGIEVESYDPTELEAFADRLHAAGGVHLVVGHSNTTPDLVEALGGEPGTPVDEDEYDRLYRVWVDGNGNLRSELRRFGEPFGGG